MSVSGVSTLNTSSSSSTKSLNTLADNYEMFLTLLTEQLKNQDPLNPMDTNEFTSQLVQYSSVEQQISQNKNLEKLIALQGNNINAQAVNYLGAIVVTDGPTGGHTGEGIDWGYNLASKASTVKLEVTDEAGKVVYTTTGETAAGDHTFNWDGKNASGDLLPNGAYTLKVTATDSGGNKVSTTIETAGYVGGVETSDDGPLLMLGAAKIPLDKVKSIH
ncbi:MAG: flagellar hook assembly protein FlgD [Thalassobaculales bacterium]